MTKRNVTQTANQSLVVLRSDEMPESYSAAATIEESGAQVMHRFGPRVLIGRIPEGAQESITAQAGVRSVHAEEVSRAPERLTETEELGLEAWNLRNSPMYEEAKAERPRNGEKWDSPDVSETPDGMLTHTGESEMMGAPSLANEDMSPYLIGSVAVGIIMVEGPTAALRFTDAERAKIVAEVQEGLTWLGSREPRASVTWSYDIKTVRVDVAPNASLTGYEPLEGLWRNPAMAKLGYASGIQGVRDYVAKTRTNLGTRWGYVSYFTKYPVNHFAYAAKPRLVMHYQNDGWGPDNIDRVFTHETGHIFGCPDEYSSAGCNCSTLCGYLREKNGNCQSCASPFQECLMAANSWAMCKYTPVHLGWRDSDGDGTLDPVDPISNAANAAVDWRSLCRRFPWICEALGLEGLGLSAQAEASSHESIPLFLLRRALDADQMAKVQALIEDEENQYVDALAKKLNTIAKDIKANRQPQAKPAAKSKAKGKSAAKRPK